MPARVSARCCQNSLLSLFVWINLSLLAVLAFQPPVVSAATAPDVTAANWYWGPGNRWAYRNTRRIYPSADIPRGNGPVAHLEYAVQDIDEITFSHPTTGAPMTIREMYTATDTDAFLVLKDG